MNSNIALTIGTSYFIVVTYNGLVARFIVVNLATGAATTTTVSNAKTIQATTQGLFSIGSYYSSSYSCASEVSAVMYSASYMSLPQLLAWAA